MSEECCFACKFWKYAQETDDDGNELAEDVVSNMLGYCRRSPPQLVSAYFELRRHLTLGFESMGDCDEDWPPCSPSEAQFPTTLGDDWCGEYQPIHPVTKPI